MIKGLEARKKNGFEKIKPSMERVGNSRENW